MHPLAGASVRRLPVVGGNDDVTDTHQLSQQQHADVAWAVAHLVCSRHKELCAAAAQLHAALRVPFVVLPAVLPGLSLDAFKREVPLAQDTIYLEGRAVPEARLTGEHTRMYGSLRILQVISCADHYSIDAPYVRVRRLAV
jgi:hypothetical protein